MRINLTPVDRQPISPISLGTLWSQTRSAEAAVERNADAGEKRVGGATEVRIPVDYIINDYGNVLRGYVAKVKIHVGIDEFGGFIVQAKGGTVHFDAAGRAEVTRRSEKSPEGCTQCQGCEQCEWCGKGLPMHGAIDVYQLLEPLTEAEHVQETLLAISEGRGTIKDLTDEQLGQTVRSIWGNYAFTPIVKRGLSGMFEDEVEA